MDSTAIIGTIYPLHPHPSTLNTSLIDSFPISTMSLVNPTTRPFGILPHKPSKTLVLLSLASQSLPQYGIDNMFLKIFGKPQTRWSHTLPHIVYHSPVTALITEPGSQAPDWKGSGLCCLLSKGGGCEGSCSPAPIRPHQAGRAPSLHKLGTAWALAQSCRLTWSMSPTPMNDRFTSRGHQALMMGLLRTLLV